VQPSKTIVNLGKKGDEGQKSLSRKKKKGDTLYHIREEGFVLVPGPTSGMPLGKKQPLRRGSFLKKGGGKTSWQRKGTFGQAGGAGPVPERKRTQSSQLRPKTGT